jgi:hypothetical protein
LGGQVRRFSDRATTSGPVVDTSRSFSVAAWVRADTAQGVVVSQPGTNKSPFELQYVSGRQQWCFFSYASDTVNAAATATPACSPDPVQVGVWVHLTGVYDSGSSTQLALYVNGVRKGTGSTGAPAWASAGPLTIGAARNGAAAGFFNGAVSEVRVWDRVVDPDVDLLPVVQPVLVGQWDMEDADQEEPRQAGDSSGYQRPLTLSVAPSADWTADGYDSAGLQFDGVSGATQTNGPVLRTDQSYTVTAWARFTGGTGARTVIAQDGQQVSSSFLSCRTDAGESAWSVMYRNVDSTSSSAVYAIGGQCVINRWTHLAAVLDRAAGTLSLYIDGALAARSALAYTVVAGA